MKRNKLLVAVKIKKKSKNKQTNKKLFYHFFLSYINFVLISSICLICFLSQVGREMREGEKFENKAINESK